jgi:ubiquinone/menaquinone biosynthesis C-methylase UbiE
MAARRIIVPPRLEEVPRFVHRRVLEPEVMEEPEGVAAYVDGASEEHLERLDAGFVRAAVRWARSGARVLDVGTGSGSIPLKMALRRPDLTLVGVDLSEGMLRAARERLKSAGLGGRLRFRRADARRLPFRRGSFDLVISNSLIHHLADPVPVLDEIARVLAPGGRIFLRDLRRPGPSRIRAHIRRHGRFYKGEMLRLFDASVRAAFKVAEVRELVGLSRLAGCRVRPQLETYLVVEGSPRRRRRARR